MSCGRSIVILLVIFVFEAAESASTASCDETPSASYENTNAAHPCGKFWYYSNKNGKCYRFFTRCSLDEVVWEEAKRKCGELTTENGARVNGRTDLAKFGSFADQQAASEMTPMGNFERHWLGAKQKNIDELVVEWMDGSNSSLPKDTIVSPLSGNETERCAALHISINVENNWVLKTEIELRSCSEKLGFFCEYEAKNCNSLLGNDFPKGYDPASMKPTPKADLFVNTTASLVCKDGHFRNSAARADKNNLPYEHPKVVCTGVATPDFNPDEFVPQLIPNSEATIEICLPKKCKQLDMKPFKAWNIDRTITDMTLYNDVDYFDYGFEVKVVCRRGFVSYKNPNSAVSSKLCMDGNDMSLGFWVPNGSPCEPLRCNYTELLTKITPLGTVLAAARNAENGQLFTQAQRNNFDIFKNVVEIECENSDFFFDDRSDKKTVICDVANNSDTRGVWRGYQGTKLPIVTPCEQATCKNQDIKVKDDDGKYMEDLHFKSQYVISNSRRSSIIMDIMGPAVEDLVFGTTVNFTCIDGSKSSLGENGVVLTCGKGGHWIPDKLTGCIEATPKIATYNNKKKYVPPPAEVENASYIGSMVLILIILFIVFVILLDLSTVSRDYLLMRRNISNLSRKYKMMNKKE